MRARAAVSLLLLVGQLACNGGELGAEADHASDMNGLAEAPWPQYPSGTTESNRPTFWWSPVGAAFEYWLLVRDSTGHGVSERLWWSQVCNESRCSYQPRTPLALGPAQWWILASDRGGDGPWSEGREFNVGWGLLPEMPVLIAPWGNGTDPRPIFQWHDELAATSYRLEIHDGSRRRFEEVYEAATHCTASICQVTPDFVLDPGTTTWWVRGSNESGDGPWSEGWDYILPEFGSGTDPGLAHPCPPDGVRVEAAGAFADDGVDDTAAIQQAIDDATPGTVVCFGTGTYDLNRNLSLPGQRHLLGGGTTLRGPAAGMSPSLDIRAASDVSLRGLRLERVVIAIVGTVQGGSNATDVVVEDCEFAGGITETPPEYSVQVLLSRAARVRIASSRFLRGADEVGASILVWRSSAVTIEDSSWNGHFMTAVNVQGAAELSPGELEQSRDVQIVRNHIARTPGLYAEDHGIYSWGADGLFVIDNEIRGWSSTATGGAVKARNGDRTTIQGNHFENSGVLLYTYDGTVVPHLRDVLVADNVIDVAEPLLLGRSVEETYGAIQYWRSFASTDLAVEQAITLRDNTIVGGGVEVFEPAVAEAFQITGNRGTYFRAPPGVDISGNTIVATPARVLAKPH